MCELPIGLQLYCYIQNANFILGHPVYYIIIFKSAELIKLFSALLATSVDLF